MYTDSNWGGDEAGLSTAGWVFMISGCAVAWACKKQQSISISTTEAELYAASIASSVLIWFRRLLRDLGQDVSTASILREDNAGAIVLSEDPSQSTRARHIAIREQFVYQYVQRGEIKLVWVKSAENIADIMTKIQSKKTFSQIVKLLLGE